MPLFAVRTIANPEANPMWSVESRRTTLAPAHVHSIDASTHTRQSVALSGALFFRNRCRHCVTRSLAVRSECSHNCDRVED
jgi:hypothetical protein